MMQIYRNLRTSPIAIFFSLFLLLGACAPISRERLSRPVPPPALSPTYTLAAIPARPDMTGMASEDIEPEEIAVSETDQHLEEAPLPPEEVLPEYDFPMADNRYVDYHLKIFTTRDRDNFRRWLEQAGRYKKMIVNQLAEAGLPLDLAYLPLIESGYSLNAYSRARAVGPWQFLRSTARMYGLRVDKYVDERRDPIKATAAAIRFLKDMYNDLGDWWLTVAAYNGGIGRVGNAVRRARTDNFWELIRRHFLKRETRNYVPRLIAAIMIAKNPEEYGFDDLEPAAPMAFETVNIAPWTSLRAVATAGGVDLSALKALNRHLRRGITPPDAEPGYPVRVPVGSAAIIRDNIDRVYATVRTTFRTHVTKRGETIGRICRRYRISRTTLLKANNLTSTRLKTGRRLRIPVQRTIYKLSPVKLAQMRPGKDNSLIMHRIKPGESIWSIARKYDIPAHLIASWNNLTDISRIRAGDQLALFISGRPDNNKTPRMAALLPRIVTSEDALPGDIRADAQGTGPTYYKVRKGDTLWDISQRFQVTPAKIRRLNGLEDNTIFPGSLLILKEAGDIDA